MGVDGRSGQIWIDESVFNLLHDDNDDSLVFQTDYFRTTPLFIARTQSGQLHITAKIADLLSLPDLPKTVDTVGVWEFLLFGNPIGKRTLHKEIVQIPSHATLTVDKSSCSYQIKYRDAEHVELDTSALELSGAVNVALEALNHAFEKLDRQDTYLVGLSGGLDSRLAVALLSQHVPKRNIRLYTYGHSDAIYEYKYAKDVASTLGLAVPEFHLLDARTYRHAMNYLPRTSGGLLGIGHVHALDYLHGLTSHGDLHLSTLASDAVLGWAAGPSVDYSPDGWRAMGEIASQLVSSYEVQTLIKADLSKLGGAMTQPTFSNWEEFYYVRERNAKFHTYLAFLQHQQIAGPAPFADRDLMMSFLSIPTHFRHHKRLVDEILRVHYPGISDTRHGHISSRFQWGGEFASRRQWIRYRLTGGVSSTTAYLSHGKLQVSNPFETEDLGGLLHREFRQDLLASESALVDIGVINNAGELGWGKPPLRSRDAAGRFDLLSVGALIADGLLCA